MKVKWRGRCLTYLLDVFPALFGFNFFVLVKDDDEDNMWIFLWGPFLFRASNSFSTANRLGSFGFFSLQTLFCCYIRFFFIIYQNRLTVKKQRNKLKKIRKPWGRVPKPINQQYGLACHIILGRAFSFTFLLPLVFFLFQIDWQFGQSR